MKCLRCGYCCKTSMVVIIDDPNGPFEESNFIARNLLEDGPCKHLLGEISGKYSCAVHDKKWYKRTPCYAHGQIEESNDCECRIGRYIIDKRR
jgi:hypothetical protein